MKFSTSHMRFFLFWPVLASQVSSGALLPLNAIVQTCEIHYENLTAPDSLTTFMFSLRQFTSFWLKCSFLS